MRAASIRRIEIERAGCRRGEGESRDDGGQDETLHVMYSLYATGYNVVDTRGIVTRLPSLRHSKSKTNVALVNSTATSLTTLARSARSFAYSLIQVKRQ